MFFLLSSFKLKKGVDTKDAVGFIKESDFSTAISRTGLSVVRSYLDKEKEGDCQIVFVLKNGKGRRYFLEAVEEIFGPPLI
ncbi:hypothetical protein L6270_03560 [Candidatus Parcubacteria bacterium]|nr:hypothetical protein [Patescibacteria group bacterium]MBU4309041.1 hypothetical protein [Patescibacteria group bacterium]MBU4431960.1 hypothetical protein [Patescibacteria group bacterium]MBU4577402.1 hypothetical protein [Patescibacteria group bacterium]MCG2697090.1 hypothetical protein [Candidatus Parcubacteria bacterium]